MLVTTSRLQRLGRGIFSRKNDGAACTVGALRVAGYGDPSPVTRRVSVGCERVFRARWDLRFSWSDATYLAAR
jgi:hypothetical protein